MVIRQDIKVKKTYPKSPPKGQILIAGGRGWEAMGYSVIPYSDFSEEFFEKLPHEYSIISFEGNYVTSVKRADGIIFTSGDMVEHYANVKREIVAPYKLGYFKYYHSSLLAYSVDGKQLFGLRGMRKSTANEQ